jgi:RNA-directed DNA polymerase
MYIERWPKAATLKKDGSIENPTTRSAQGSVLSALLSNVFMHFVFDKWMEKYNPAICI